MANASASEPRNPFYLLLLVVSLLFAVTALAVTMDLFVERKTIAVEPWPSREFLRAEGGRLLLYELAAVAALALASVGLDRFRRLQKDRACATIPPSNPPSQSP